MCAALPTFRQRKDLRRAVFTAPFDVMASVLALALTICLLSYVDYKKEGLAMLILAAVGLAVYFAYKILGARGNTVIAEPVDGLPAGKPSN